MQLIYRGHQYCLNGSDGAIAPNSLPTIHYRYRGAMVNDTRSTVLSDPSPVLLQYRGNRYIKEFVSA
jgi:hypothetical protein